MALLDNNDAAFIKNLFGARLKREVKVRLFVSSLKCQSCKETELLLKEISKQSDMMKLEVIDIDENKDAAKEQGIDKIPATVILSNNGSNLYFFGMPSGYQLKSLIDDVVDACEGSSQLSGTAQIIARAIYKPVDIKVFVTPACPYSPIAVRTAHRFAIENQHIRAQMIETLEFEELTKKYHIMGVPTTIVNETFRFEGALDDDSFAKKISEATK